VAESLLRSSGFFTVALLLTRETKSRVLEAGRAAQFARVVIPDNMIAEDGHQKHAKPSNIF
jgi:hypothetical protein